MSMRLTSANVEYILHECLFDRVSKSVTVTPEEEAATRGSPKAIIVEGILHDYAFEKAQIDKYRGDILSMVKELPPTFFKHAGGGWSFLNLCENANGELWTGLHMVCEQLCLLAIAAKIGQWTLPRELWPSMGGLPYITFDVAEPVGTA